MRQLNVYSIYDAKAKFYGVPFYFETDELAIRVFGDAVNADPEKSEMAKHPFDFMLFRIGVYDKVDGTITGEKSPIPVSQGKDVFRPVDNVIQMEIPKSEA
jgi:hypothetical protein